MRQESVQWRSTRCLFLVRPLASGLWLARESEGRAEGVFRRREDAVRFARLEGGRLNAVLLLTRTDGSVPTAA